jgi:hypothetical protein
MERNNMDDKTIEMHRTILMAYMSRLTLADIQDMHHRAKDCTYAGMNLGNQAQINAHAALYASVCRAIGNMIRHDKELINQIIERETCSQ